MYTGHYDTFNEAINSHGLYASRGDHDIVLYHESKMYALADEYLERVNDLNMSDADSYLRNMLHHIDVIDSYVLAGLSTFLVMFEMLDVKSTAN